MNNLEVTQKSGCVKPPALGCPPEPQLFDRIWLAGAIKPRWRAAGNESRFVLALVQGDNHSHAPIKRHRNQTSMASTTIDSALKAMTHCNNSTLRLWLFVFINENSTSSRTVPHRAAQSTALPLGAHLEKLAGVWRMGCGCNPSNLLGV